MFLTQTLPPTRFDLNFSVLGIPVRVHPLFWLIALLLGSSSNLLFILIWIIVVFISILVHELGHALAFRRYGVDSHIVLHMMGGLTIPDAAPWGTGYASVSSEPKQEIFISLAGPFTGFLFAALVIAGVVISGGAVQTTWLFGFIPLPLSPILPINNNMLSIFVATLLWVNIFWGLINLLPVYPMDGGQVARNVLIQYDPMDGVRKSVWLSVITGAILALVGFFIFNSRYMAILFGLLAFQSYQSLQGRY